MSHLSFLGIPVEGTITAGDRVQQRPLAELQPLLRALLDDEAVVEFGWQQYTPYFNDGEPCIFTIYGLWVRTVKDDAYDHGELIISGWGDRPHPSLGIRQADGYGAERVHQPYRGDDEARYEQARALADALCDGAFHDILLDAFGDHADVLVRRTGIIVEFYDHE